MYVSAPLIKSIAQYTIVLTRPLRGRQREAVRRKRPTRVARRLPLQKTRIPRVRGEK